MIWRKTSTTAAAVWAAAAALVPEVWGAPPEGKGAGEPVQTDAYVQSIDAWHADREARLRRDDSWLTLVGLFPLEQGDQSFGSAKKNDIVFPGNAPEEGGVIRVVKGRARVAAAPGVELRVDDEVVGECELESDAAGRPTVVELGTFTFYVIDRAGRLYLRVKDRDAQALREFSGIQHFPVDPRWRVTARFHTYDPPHKIMVPNVLGTEFEEDCPGVAVFQMGGRECRLEPTGEAGEPLFFVFGDETNGSETYGGGRFLVADPPGPDGTVVLDFNKAYNPPCFFTPYATCPLPPEGNRLAVRVEAGEKASGRGSERAAMER